MICSRCGDKTPRLTLTQRYCPPCGRDVEATIRRDAERRQPRFPQAKELTLR